MVRRDAIVTTPPAIFSGRVDTTHPVTNSHIHQKEHVTMTLSELPPTGPPPRLDDTRTSPRRDMVLFGVLTFAVSWIPWTALAVAHADLDSGVAFLVFALAASAPSLAALAMRIAGRRRLPESAARLSMTWPCLALVLAGSPALVAAMLEHPGHLSAISHHAGSTISSVGGPLGALAYTLISGPLSEEFGWRGFLQPRLRRVLGPRRAVLVIGAAWGSWHLPLFFLNGTGQHDQGLLSLGGLLFLATLFPLSYLILFVSERLRGGVWAAIVAHAAYNLSGALVPDPGTVATVATSALFFLVAGGCWLAWRPAERNLGHEHP